MGAQVVSIFAARTTPCSRTSADAGEHLLGAKGVWRLRGMAGILPAASLWRADPGRGAAGKVPIYKRTELGGSGEGEPWQTESGVQGAVAWASVPTTELGNQVQEVEACHSLLYFLPRSRKPGAALGPA